MYISEIYGKGGIYAKCVSASSSNNINLYTLEIQAPKFIDAQFEKHRMLSSNSSSSRAIPFGPLKELYLPFDVRKNQSGMQGIERFDADETRDIQEDIREAYRRVYDFISDWDYLSAQPHKQHLNRYLEPWMFQKKVVTATEWDNFFSLRIDDAAQPEIQELARCMKEAIDKAEVTELLPGEYHLPYITEIYDMDGLGGSLKYVDAIKASVARCARVSYLNHDNTNPNIKKDVTLHDTLLEHRHLSPFEHVATPMNGDEFTYMHHYNTLPKGITHIDSNLNAWSGNFRGFIQYRQLIGENINV